MCLWVAVMTLSFAFPDLCAHLPTRLRGPGGLPAASHTWSGLESGTKHSSTSWVNYISVSRLNYSQAEGQRETKGWSTRVQCNTANFIPWFRKPLLLLLVSHCGLATDNIPGLRLGTSRHHHVVSSQPLSEAVPPLFPFTHGERKLSSVPQVTPLAWQSRDWNLQGLILEPVLLNSREANACRTQSFKTPLRLRKASASKF